MLRGNDLRLLARSLLDHLGVETSVLVFLYSGEETAELVILDSAGSYGDLERVQISPDIAELTSLEKSRMLNPHEIRVLTKTVPCLQIQRAIGHVVSVSNRPVGLLVAINPAKDVDSDVDSLDIFNALGMRLSTILENRGLSDEVSELTERVEALDRLLESKDRLIASVSHELRTPLTSVIGMSVLARDIARDSESAEVVEMLNLVVEQGTEMSNIIDDLLAHASNSADAMAMHTERFDLAEEVAIIATTHNLEAPAADGGLWVFADRLRVRQIVRNLITNARRYGGERVWLAYGIRSDRLSISVVDDGFGVSEGAEETIFEPYKSAHAAAGRQGSVGLGLALSQSMAQMMGGEVTYERRDGETWFSLELPAVKSIAVTVDDSDSAKIHDLEVERAIRQA